MKKKGWQYTTQWVNMNIQVPSLQMSRPDTTKKQFFAHMDGTGEFLQMGGVLLVLLFHVVNPQRHC